MNGSGDFFHHAFLLIGEEVLLVYAADRILQRGNLLIAGFAFSDEFLLGDRAGYAQVDQLRALILDSLNLLFEFFNMRIVGVYGKHGLNDRKQICGDFLFL